MKITHSKETSLWSARVGNEVRKFVKEEDAINWVEFCLNGDSQRLYSWPFNFYREFIPTYLFGKVNNDNIDAMLNKLTTFEQSFVKEFYKKYYKYKYSYEKVSKALKITVEAAKKLHDDIINKLGVYVPYLFTKINIVDNYDNEINAILYKRIEELNLSVRVYNCLKELKIVNVLDLLNISNEELEKTIKLGPVSMKEINDARESIKQQIENIK